MCNVHIMHLHSTGDMPLQGEENVCDDMNGDMHLLRLIKDWGYDSMLPQNRRHQSFYIPFRAI